MRLIRRWSDKEQGQALVLSTLFLTVVLGCAAMSIDIGRMASTRRQMQNAADAGALAGAQKLPADPSEATVDSVDWLENNNALATEVTENIVFRTNISNDTIRVRIERSVPYTFGRVLGLNSHGINATATARVVQLRGIKGGQPRAFPYAVWDGNKNKKKLGDIVTFRSNSYQAVNVDDNVNCTKGGKNPPPGCTWDVSGNNFKGYFHWQNGYNYYVKPTMQAFSQGGNAFGTDDAEAMWAYYQAGTPVILPVVNWGKDPNGNELDWVIPAFVCIEITQMDKSGSIDWKGKIVQCAGPGLTDGPNPPSLDSSYVVRLVQ